MVDINCDLGESFGNYQLGNDTEVINYITSCNIACGYHAGDPLVMEETVKLAIQHGVKVGAHPSFPDLNGFGRRYMQLSKEELRGILLYQIGALKVMTEVQGGKLHHVKPHGALYNALATDYDLSLTVARTIYEIDENLVLYGLSGSQTAKAAEDIGLSFAHEVFADRRYKNDGTLVSRREEGAVIKDVSEVIKQVEGMVNTQEVTTLKGEVVKVKADTICVHGDTEGALAMVQKIRQVV